MFHLASLATPTQPPIASHQRGSRLASRRTTRYNVIAQNRKSGVVVVSSCAAPMYSPQVAAASAASTWPVRPAPSRRLIAAVSNTIAPGQARAEPAARRRCRRPALRDTRASNGVSGGWST